MKITRTLVLGLLALGFSGVAASAAELDWPEVTSETKPWSRWWWLGSIGTKKDFTTEMELCARAGLGGLEITPIYGVRGEESRFITYLTPQWMEMLDHVLDEGQRLGLGIDMATGNGWPFGGPWVTPDYAARHVVTKSFAVKGGERLAERVAATDEPWVRVAGPRSVKIGELKDPVTTNDNLQDLALDQVRFPRALPLQALRAVSDRGEKIDLTQKVAADGQLDWTAPTGNWTLYAVFMGWHGKQVERAGPGGEGDVIDHFSSDALARYLKKFDEAYVGHRTDRLRAYFNDSYEVDDADGESNWTPQFFDEFKKRRGYDLRDELPAFFGKDTEEKNARVMSDHRETISDLLLEEYTQPWAKWASKHKAIIRNQAHGSPANILDLYAASGIPETEGASITGMKLASSAAHVTGKKLASSETATWLDEHWLSTLGDIKRRVDLTFLSGVNHNCYHGTAFSPAAELWPGFHFYASVELNPSNSIWADFDVLNAYVTRVQSFLQAGKPANDVLLYYPIHDTWGQRGNGAMPHFGSARGMSVALAQELLNRGYTFDYVSDRLLSQVKASGGELETGGNRYRVIVVPQAKFIPVETMKKLWELAEAGATIVFHKSVPSDVPGFGRLAERRAAFETMRKQLDGAPSKEGIATLARNRGRLLVGEDIEKTLTAAGVPRETLVDRELQFERRLHDKGHVYFLLNRGAERLQGWIPVATQAASAALFDPNTGKAGVAQTRRSADGRDEIYVELAPGETCLVKTFAQDRVNGTAFSFWKPAGEATAVTGTWSLRFVSGGPTLPAEVPDVRELRSWIELGGAETKAFSGTAVYRTKVSVPAAGDYLLDLGRVSDSARVRLNGREIATLISPPWRALVSRAQLREGENELEVLVTNLSANRVADLDRRNPGWKRFYNINYPARRPENRGPDGNFSAAKWAPRESGLIGPVSLIPVVAAEPK